MVLLVLSVFALLLALLPLLMTARNLAAFQPPVDAGTDSCKDRPGVSVLIPARNEERSIGDCIISILASDYPQFEVIVMDDASADQTGNICREIMDRDARVKLLSGSGLPDGWNGKQHACWRLAQAAIYDRLLFIDADVRLSSDALSLLTAEQDRTGTDLLSGFPKQITGSLLERLLIPLMHFILLGYLPLDRMRTSTGPEFAAGCGQLFLARRSGYFQCDGHRSIAASRHDGIKLPRSFRRSGLKTDLTDATQLATCRMYHSAAAVLRGLLKNADEGIASPKTIVPFTILLGGAAVLPAVLCAIAWLDGASPLVKALSTAALVISYRPRVLLSGRFSQSWIGVILHPIAVAVFLVLQWTALIMSLFGWKLAWRGRI
ncbi:MAG: glycosyltransferase [Pirellulales bacterium]